MNLRQVVWIGKPELTSASAVGMVDDAKLRASQVVWPHIPMRWKVALMLGVLLFIAGALRGYHAGALMRFTGDEARDIFMARSIATQHARPLLGPKIHLGYGFLGPAYAYLLALPLKLGGLDPAVAVYLTIVCDLGATLLIYVLGKEMFGDAAGLGAALLYTTSFTMVFYGRWGWHPGLVPGCTLFILTCMRYVQKGRVGYLAPLMGCMGLALQFHLSTAFLLIPLAPIVWQARKTIRAYVIAWSFLLLGVALAPLVYHELMTGFQNSRSMLGALSIVSSGQPQPLLPYLLDAVQVVADQAFVGSSERVALLEGWRWVYAVNVGLFFASMVYGILALRHDRAGLYFLALWGIPILLALSLYPGTRPHYYLLLWFPLPCLLVGALWGRLAIDHLGRWLAVGLMALLVTINLATYASYLSWLQQGNYSYFYSAPLQDKKRAIETIVTASGGQAFDLIVVSWHWSNHLPYAYLLAYRQAYPHGMQMFEMDENGVYTLHTINTSGYFPQYDVASPTHQVYLIVEPASQKLPQELEKAVIVADVGLVRVYRAPTDQMIP